jgi:hypothetical protein
MNDFGSVKITKQIMAHLMLDNNKINEIDKVLQKTTMHNYKGDLTTPINLKNQALVTELNLCENTDKLRNIMFHII